MTNATLNFFINFLTVSLEVLLVDLTNTRPIGNGVLVASLRPHGSLVLDPDREVNPDVSTANIHLGMPLGYANSSISINVGVNL